MQKNKANMEKKKKPRLKNQMDSLLVAFDLKQSFDGEILNDWLQASGTLTAEEKSILGKIHRQSINKIRGWNEEELKMKMISLLFFLADIDEDGKIGTFYERPMHGEWGDFEISVIADCMVATPFGLTTPKAPYFFLQELKKHKGDSQDPEGQMLAAMLVAQKENADERPVYGAWLTGSIWYFSILKDRNYFTSSSFDATVKKELEQILFILKKLKSLLIY